MKYFFFLLLILPFLSGDAASQAFSSHPSKTAKAAKVQVADEPVMLELENQGKARVSPALIERIFRETVREVAWQLNPERPPRIMARVTLRLGASGFTVETIEGRERRTIISMQEWDEFAFARMVARAARNGLFSDQELDRYARAGLARARAVASVQELKGD